MVAYIRQGLEQDPSGDLHEEMFLRLLRFTLKEADAASALRVAIEWGRYGNLFEYNFLTTQPTWWQYPNFNTGVLQRPKGEESIVE